MKRTASALALSALLSVPTLANAVVISASYEVNANLTDPGLVINTAEIADNPFSFDLDVGESETFSLFRIWTNESDVGNDDEAALPISVDFSFLLPSAFGGSVDGSTFGVEFLFGLAEWGQVSWNAPLELTFGAENDGLIRIDLSNEIFNKGIGGLKEGEKHASNVYATLTLVRDASVSVPEPASVALLGLGMLALGLRRQRQQ